MDLDPGKHFDKYIKPNSRYFFMVGFYVYYYITYFLLSSMTTGIPDWIETVVWIYLCIGPLVFLL